MTHSKLCWDYDYNYNVYEINFSGDELISDVFGIDTVREEFIITPRKDNNHYINTINLVRPYKHNKFLYIDPLINNKTRLHISADGVNIQDWSMEKKIYVTLLDSKSLLQKYDLPDNLDQLTYDNRDGILLIKVEYDTGQVPLLSSSKINNKNSIRYLQDNFPEQSSSFVIDDRHKSNKLVTIEKYNTLDSSFYFFSGSDITQQLQELNDHYDSNANMFGATLSSSSISNPITSSASDTRAQLQNVADNTEIERINRLKAARESEIAHLQAQIASAESNGNTLLVEQLQERLNDRLIEYQTIYPDASVGSVGSVDDRIIITDKKQGGSSMIIGASIGVVVLIILYFMYLRYIRRR